MTASGRLRFAGLRRSARLLLGLFLAALAPAASAAEFSGPLPVSDQFLLTVGSLAVEPSPYEIEQPGKWRVSLSGSIANTFTRSRSVQLALEARTERLSVDDEFLTGVPIEPGERTFFLDGELLRTELRLSRGLARGMEIEFRLPWVYFGGGVMDGFLEDFHSLVGLDQDGRLGVLRNRSFVFVDLVNGERMLDPASGLTLIDPVLAAKRRFELARPGRSLLLAAEAKLPLADDDGLASSGSADFGAQAQWSSCGRRQCVFSAFNVRWLGSWRLLDLSSRVVPAIYAGLERKWADLTWVVQLVIAGSVVDGIDVNDLDAEAWQLSGGIHKRLDRYSWTLALSENVAHFENGADLTFHWALSRSF